MFLFYNFDSCGFWRYFICQIVRMDFFFINEIIKKIEIEVRCISYYDLKSEEDNDFMI